MIAHRQIDAETAEKEKWDVVVVGSSFSSMFFVKGISRRLRVLIIERGSFIGHSTQLINGLDVHQHQFVQRNHTQHLKTWVSHTMFGGNSNCWWACTPRFHPNDFKINSLYGVGVDWPIDYDDLEDFYQQAEVIMEVNGEPSEELPRSSEFPHPAHVASRSDEVIKNGGALWWAQPSARATTGTRPPCCANGVCHLCPIDSKFTILNSFGKFDHDNIKILVGSLAYQLEVTAGIANKIIVKTSAGSFSIRGDLFALGANAIFNTEIMLRSGFSSPALGHYLHEQVSINVIADVKFDNYFGGTSITGHGYDFYDGSHRSSLAAVLIENVNSPASIRPEKGKWMKRLFLKLIAEDLPQFENRVFLENDSPVIDWHGHHPYALDGLEHARGRLQELIPGGIESMSVSVFAPTEAHIQGTHRMGLDVQSSVVNQNLISHECQNLVVLGAGVFPSCSPANPTLTLSALSLFAAARL